MVSVDIGAREGAFGELFKGLGSAFQSQMEANQRGAASKARLAFEEKKWDHDKNVKAEQLRSTKMNTALNKLRALTTGNLKDIKKQNPALWKMMASGALTSGYGMQSDTELHKVMLSALSKEGVYSELVLQGMQQYAQDLTQENREFFNKYAETMDASDAPALFEKIRETAEANKKRKATEKAMQILSPTGGRPGMGRDAVESYESPEDIGRKSLSAYQKLVEAGADPSKVAHLLLRKDRALKGEKITQEILNLAGKTAHIRSKDGTWRSVPVDKVRDVLLAEPDAQVFQAGTFTGTDFSASFIPKRQAGKVRAVRVKMAGLMSKSQILLDAFKRLGSGIGGFRGTFGNFIGGILGQISPVLGEIVTKGITGASQQELAHFRSDARALIAETVPVYTGEESGRVSGPELRISEQATKVLAGTASQEEIIGALKSIINATFLKSERALVETSGELTWGFIRADGSRDDRAMAFAYDKIKKVSKMDKKAVLSVLSDLAIQQRTLILGKLWKGLEAQ